MSLDNDLYSGGESISYSQLGSIMDPVKLSAELKNMKGDVLNRPVKYSQPKYSEVQKTYKVLEPITKKSIRLPEKHSKKIRTTEPVFIDPIYVTGKDGLTTALSKDIDESNIPLPTASVINNLCQSSMVQSSYYPELYDSKYDPGTQQSKTTSNIYEANNDPILQQPYQQKLKAQKSIHQSNHLQDLMTSHIDKPIVLEGQSLKESAIKENQSNANQSIVQSNIQQSNMNQQSIKQSNVPQHSIHQSNTKQSNIHGQSQMNQSNIPHQSNISHQSQKQSAYQQQSNIHGQSQMNQSNIPHQSQKQSAYQQQSNIHGQSQMNQSNIPHQSNISHQSQSNQHINDNLIFMDNPK